MRQRGRDGMLDRFIDWNKRASRRLERNLIARSGATDGDYRGELLRRLRDDLGSRDRPTVLEVGGIDRPLLPRDPAYEYVGLDIEHRPGCDAAYDRFVVGSVAEPLGLEADVIVSITLLEHVPDNRAAVAAMRAALRPGGSTHHYVPSKWHPYSLALRLVGARWQRRLIARLRSEASSVSGYPAFFDRCSPGAMSRLFADAGFGSVEVRPYYHAHEYFEAFLPAYAAVTCFERCCRRLGWRVFASGFVISARVPGAGET